MKKDVIRGSAYIGSSEPNSQSYYFKIIEGRVGNANNLHLTINIKYMSTNVVNSGFDCICNFSVRGDNGGINGYRFEVQSIDYPQTFSVNRFFIIAIPDGSATTLQLWAKINAQYTGVSAELLADPVYLTGDSVPVSSFRSHHIRSVWGGQTELPSGTIMYPANIKLSTAGGTITGYLESQGGSGVFSTGSQNFTTSGFIHFATLTINGTYANYPISMEIVQRNHVQSMKLYIMFLSYTTSDPNIGALNYTGENFGVYISKAAEHKWNLYIASTAWQGIDITDLKIPGTLKRVVQVDFCNNLVSALPDEVQSASKSLNGIFVTDEKWTPADTGLLIGDNINCVINSNVTHTIVGSSLTLTGVLSRRSDTVYNFVGGVDNISLYSIYWTANEGYKGARYNSSLTFP